jgi:hypothetical protein
MIKPDFWTDTELGDNLPPTGRLLYQGLWQLAEDSGIIENDPVAYKMQLFPLDNIDTQKIKDWTQKLVDLKKLIPFKVDSKDYFYIKNFHKHQALRSPGRPELPLPDFIKYIENKAKYKSGGYIIDYNKIEGSNCSGIKFIGNVKESIREQYKNGTESVPKQNRNGRETNKNKNIELEAEDNKATAKSEILQNPEFLNIADQEFQQLPEKYKKISNRINEDYFDLAAAFNKTQKEQHPNLVDEVNLKKNLNGADTIRLLIEQDGKDLDYIKKVLRWGVGDDFWQTNIRSAAALRKKNESGEKKFNNLAAAYERSKANNKEEEPQTLEEMGIL